MDLIDEKSNRRVLVVDDEESIRDSFQLVLAPDRTANDQVDAAAAALFGEAPNESDAELRTTNDIRFEVDFATNGREALEKVNASLAADLPYAVIFCDMRMPGWDGLETIEHIRAVDPRCEIVFVTAYSDQDVDSIVQSVGSDVGYFLKPFANEELRQMAIKGVLDWNRARELEKLLASVTSLRGEVEDIDRLLRFLLRQICDWLGTDSAALVQLSDANEPMIRLGVGRLADVDASELNVQQVADKYQSKPCRSDDGVTYLPIKEYGLAVALDCDDRITPDKEYLLRFFLEHASMAIRNSEMQSKLIKSEQLAAVGQAIGFIVHDLRNPLGNIRDLANAYDDPDAYGLTIDEIKKYMGQAVEMTSQLLNDILEFTRGSTHVDPESGTWLELMKPKLELIRLDLTKSEVELSIDVPDDLPMLVDSNRIIRVIRNLAKNAAEAIRSARQKHGRVTVGARPVGKMTEIWVADNGSGLPLEVQEKLFQPFATHAKSGGTGFGLAIAKQLVEAHDGDISVESSSAGTRFTIRIPAPSVSESV